MKLGSRAPLLPVLAGLVLAPLGAATFPGHKIADGCPLCSASGPFGPDGLPVYGAGEDRPTPAAPEAPVSTTNDAKSTAPRPFPKIEKDVAGRAQIGFEHLASFLFVEPPPDATPRPGSVERIPENVRALDGQRVVLSGYMVPTKLTGGLVQQFLIVRSPLVCCFGQVPAPNEWILVSVTGPGTAPVQDVPLRFAGRLRVGEISEDGVFVGIYRLELEKVGASEAAASGAK